MENLGADIEFRHLAVIEAVERHGHLTRAGAELKLSTSQVSRIITQVEELLGTRLCDRSRAGVVFSANGRLFVQRARETLAMRERTVAFGRQLAEAQSGMLRVGYTAPAAWMGMQDDLSRLHASVPEVHVSLRLEFDSRVLTDLLVTGEIDVAYLHPPVTVPNLAVRPIGSCGWSLAVSSRSPLASRESVAAADLRGLRLLQNAPNLWPVTHSQLLRRCAQEGFVPRLDFSVWLEISRLLLIGSDGGASIVASCYARDSFRGVQYVPLNEPTIDPLEAAAVWRPENDNPMLAKLA